MSNGNGASWKPYRHYDVDIKLQRKFQKLWSTFFFSHISLNSPHVITVGWARYEKSECGTLGHNNYWTETVKAGKLKGFTIIHIDVRISEKLKGLGSVFIETTLIHEAVHIALNLEGSCANCRGKIEGSRFRRKVDEIYNLGAYDGLL